jgi:hypothetical protein
MIMITFILNLFVTSVFATAPPFDPPHLDQYGHAKLLELNSELSVYQDTLKAATFSHGRNEDIQLAETLSTLGKLKASVKASKSLSEIDKQWLIGQVRSGSNWSIKRLAFKVLTSAQKGGLTLSERDRLIRSMDKRALASSSFSDDEIIQMLVANRTRPSE